MAQIGQQQGAGATTGTTTGAVPGTTTGAGSNMAADMNVSDGVADQMGYFEEPERNIYGTMPTTEGAAEMGATPYFDTAGIGSEMAQGGLDSTGIAALAAPATTQVAVPATTQAAASATTQAAAPATPSTQDLIARQRALQQAALGGNFPSGPGQRVLREGNDVLFAPTFPMNQFGEGGF
jgi:hypothetical protein